MTTLADLAPPPRSTAEKIAYRLRHLVPAARTAAWRRIVAEHPQGEAYARSWRFWGRPEQFAPGTPRAAITIKVWRWWLIMTGRGWGKTRTGAEFVIDRCEQFAKAGVRHRAALVAPTAGDARDTMVEGESGILAVCERRGYRAEYQPSKRRVLVYVDPKYPARLTLFSAERPDRLRGPQHHTAWLEEFAAWVPKVDPHGNGAFTNADLGLRLPCPDGLAPQGVITTTPKPTAAVKELDKLADTEGAGVVRTRGSLYDNLRNLAPSFVQAVLDRYEHSRLGDQEIHGLLLDVVEGALWSPTLLDAERVTDVPDTMDMVVVGVDPAGGGTSLCGIVVVGADTNASVAYTLEDATLPQPVPPEVWGAQAVAAYRRHNATVMVVEGNYGGDITRAVIHAIDGTINVQQVTAKVGKRLRAEPIATLCAGHRAKHVGYFPALEAQQTSWVPGDDSPDRLDAYVHAATRCLERLVKPPAQGSSPNRRQSQRSARWRPPVAR